MIITVTGQYIKHHPAIHLLCLRVVKPKDAHRLEQLFVAISSHIVKIKVLHGAKALHVQLPVSGGTVKPLRHEMCAAIFL